MATAASHRIGRDEVVWSFGPGFSIEEAFIFLSVACDANICGVSDATPVLVGGARSPARRQSSPGLA
jgi:hypothetical protein